MRHDDIRRRLEAATPGLWEWTEPTPGLDALTAGGRIILDLGEWPSEDYHGGRAGEEPSDADADLIAHAPEDLRTLLDENARFRAELTAIADDWADCSDARARLEREVEAMRGLLRRLEWCGDEMNAFCWLCGGVPDRHAPGCALAAALGSQ